MPLVCTSDMSVITGELLIVLVQVKNPAAVFSAELLLYACGCSCTLQLENSVLTSRDLVAVV